MNAPTVSPGSPFVIPLYPDGAPGSEGWKQEEQSSGMVVRNVTQPTLTAYLPDRAISRGTGVIICPGGAWHFLAFQHEGIDVARWLNSKGIAAFILKYRLIKTGDDFEREKQRNISEPGKMKALMEPLMPLVLSDGQQAVRTVRKGASEWGLKVDRIGIMGFSAGGSVAVNVALTHGPDCRPSFAAAIYTGEWDDVPVPSDAAPMFILCAADDTMASNSLRLYAMWEAADYPVELHVYSKGGHGFGMEKRGLPADTWISRFADWLQAHSLLSDS